MISKMKFPVRVKISKLLENFTSSSQKFRVQISSSDSKFCPIFEHKYVLGENWMNAGAKMI